MMSNVIIAVIMSFVLFLVFIFRSIFFKSRTPSLPPGPKGLPLVGNIFDMPSERQWLTFAKWGETYGDICSVTVLGQPLIILNSAKMAIDMLDKKSAIYSDRPVLQMAGELVGWKNTLVFLPYGDRFRRYRRLFHSLIGTQAMIKRFYPSEELEARKFLRRILAKPDDLAAHVRKTAGSVILRISHGYEVQEGVDPFVELADQATDQFSLASAPGGFLVDVIPALKHIPMWFPGAGFRRKAQEWSRTLAEMVERPHDFVKQQLASGTAEVSFSSSLLERKELNAEEEFDLKWTAASLYSGAADTTVSAIYSFFLALCLHPDVVKKAQIEIDSIVGWDRLPTFEDRPRLPYINALVMEIFRWHAVVPTAIPHRVMQDDIHEGYLIPKGALVIPNIWKCLHDPRVYNNPFQFNPERFLAAKGQTSEPDPREVSFGFGRRQVTFSGLCHGPTIKFLSAILESRTCPGMHLADASVFISCVMALAVFDISKCVDEGVTVEPVHECTTGTISHPVPFKCSIKPRSERAISLIQAEI